MSRGQVTIKHLKAPTSEVGWFELTQTDADHFELSFLEKSHDRLATYAFSAEDGDFRCSDGMIEFAGIEVYGVIEGTMNNFQEHRQMTVDASGQLVFNLVHGPYRSRAKPNAEQFDSAWVRYPRQ